MSVTQPGDEAGKRSVLVTGSGVDASVVSTAPEEVVSGSLAAELVSEVKGSPVEATEPSVVVGL